MDLSTNKITSCANFAGHANLRTLLLAENQLTNCAGIGNMDNLTELNLASNQITTMRDMKELPALKKLDVSKNQMETIEEFPKLLALEWLSLEENKIEKADQLQHLKGLSSLKTLNMTGNPWVDEKGDDFKKEVLIELDNLPIQKVNGDDGEVTQEDRDDAKAEKEQRIKDAEEARLAALEKQDGSEKEED